MHQARTRRRFIASALAVLSFWLLLAYTGWPRAQGVVQAASGMPGLTADERAWLDAHPSPRFGANGKAPPYTYTEGEAHKGIDAEIVRRLGRLLGVQFDVVHQPAWDEVQQMARDGRVDLLGLVPATPERRAQYLLTEPVTTVEYVLFTRSDTGPGDSIRDLAGHRVAVVGSFAVRGWIERDYPGVKLVPVRSAIEGLQLLSTGQVDGAVSTIGGATWLIREQGIVNLRLQQTLYRTPLVIAVRRDWPQLLTILNKAIAQTPPAEIDRIKAEFIGLSGEGYSRGQIGAAVAATAVLALFVLLLGAMLSLRRQRDLALAGQESEGRYRQLFEHSLDGVLQSRPDGTVLAANPAACEVFGMTEAQIRAAGRAALVDTSDPRLGELLRERERTGRAAGSLRMRRGDGSLFEAEIASALYDGPRGERLSSMVVRDVTARREAEGQLRLLQAAVGKLNDVVMITEATPLDEPGPRLVYVNDAFTRLMGWSADEVLGRSPRFLQGPETQASERRRIGSALRRGEPVRAELVNRTKDGRLVWLELQLSPVADAGGRFTHWVAVERDIGERKAAEVQRQELESQLRQSQKLEAIGTLAGGIAHDFNNIVGAILGNAALARQDLPVGHAARDALDQIQRAGTRARRLVEQILTFSRRQPERPFAPQSLGALVQETVALLRSTLPGSVRLVADVHAEPLYLLGDSTQLQQVLINLCTNAWQALKGGTGTIVMRVQPAAEGSTVLARRGLPPGRYLHLSVSDDGAGIDAQTLSRVFEPFFTTKVAGEGTGLGLAVVHGIVETHHGVIDVQSTPGVGTTFDLWFPRVEAPDVADAAVAGAAAEAEPEPPRAGRGERVLYVDDDEVMRLMVERLLQREGYEVGCAAGVDAALQKLAAQPWDVVVTDFNMSGPSGLDLARSLQALQPRLPIVLSSGFLTAAIEAEGRSVGVRRFVAKERTLEDVAGAVRAALDDAARSDGALRVSSTSPAST